MKEGIEGAEEHYEEAREAVQGNAFVAHADEIYGIGRNWREESAEFDCRRHQGEANEKETGDVRKGDECRGLLISDANGFAIKIADARVQNAECGKYAYATDAPEIIVSTRTV